MSDVFISYSRKDGDFVRWLHDTLAAKERDVWIDWEDIPRGEDWLQEIYTGIEGADALLFVVSEHSLTSEICNDEIRHALNLHKRILPLIRQEISDEVKRRVAGEWFGEPWETTARSNWQQIKKINWLFFREGDNFDESFLKLLDTLDTNQPHIRTHTRLLVRAREWEVSGRNRKTAIQVLVRFLVWCRIRRDLRDWSFLLRGSDLAEAEKWLRLSADKEPQPTELHVGFIHESGIVKRLRRRTWMYAIALVFLVIGFLAIVLKETATQKTAAETAAREDRARKSAAQAENMILDGSDVIQAARLAVQAYKEAPTVESQRALYAIAQMPMPVFILKEQAEVVGAGFSPDGTQLITLEDGGRVIVWDTVSGTPLKTFPMLRSNAASFSPDGSRIATTDWANKLRIWNANDFEQLAEIDNYGGAVSPGSFSPDGTRIVIPFQDSTVQVLDTFSGKPLLTLQGHTGNVLSAAFSPDGAHIITGSEDTTARIWDGRTGALLFTLEGHKQGVSLLSFNHDGSRLATGSWDGTLQVWDVASGERIAVLHISNPGYTGEFVRGSFSVHLSPDGQQMITTHADGSARVLSAMMNASPIVLETQDVIAADFSPDGTQIVTAHADGTARMWDARSGEQQVVFQSHADNVLSVHFSSSGTQIVTTSADHTARLWNTSSSQWKLPLEERYQFSRSCFSQDETRVAFADWNNQIHVMDAQTGKQLSTLVGHSDEVLSMDFSPDATRIVTAGRDKTVRVWDVLSGDLLYTFTDHTDDVVSARFNPDGTRIVTASWDGTAQLWDTTNGKLLTTLKGHTSNLSSACFSPDGTRVVTTSWDDTARIWDAPRGELLFVLEKRAPGINRAFAAGVNYAEFSQDGTRIVTTGNDSVVRIWDAITGKQVTTLWADNSDLLSAHFNLNGTRIATANSDNVVQIWDTTSGRLLTELQGHQSSSDTTISSGISSVGFSQDGTRVISIGSDETVRVWDTLSGKPLATFDVRLYYAASVSPDGTRVFAQWRDGLTWIWIVDTEEILRRVEARLTPLEIER